ncbi:MAG: hypothetical protein IJI57_15555 [Flexilinea sp.]|nr:hypothetical protein [Flexilinea sp.]
MDKDFDSIYDILGKMRPVRYIEHPNTKGFITPFIGRQIEICEAFDFEVPAGCAPDYVVRKTNKGKRGRPRKNALVDKDL